MERKDFTINKYRSAINKYKFPNTENVLDIFSFVVLYPEVYSVLH